MMRILVLLAMFAALVGCKDSSNKARDTAREAESTARDVGRTVEGAGRAVEGAGREAYATGQGAYAAGRDAVGVARTVKAELDKVYKTDHAYDLDITRAGASKEHAAELAKMPHVTVRGVTVGYEETATRSLHGVGYRKHFRATWRRGDEDVIVSYATQDDIDVVAFAKLVEKMVPIVEKAID